jgi:hypothetical protein
VDAINGSTPKIEIGNVLDLESLSTEFQFGGLVHRVAEYVSQHPSVEVTRLKAAVVQLQGQVVAQDRAIAELTAAKADQDWQMRAMRAIVSDLEKRLQHESEKVSGLRDAWRAGIVPPSIDDTVRFPSSKKAKQNDLKAKPGTEFPPLVKKGKLKLAKGGETIQTFDIPDGIIAHLTRECGGNVHDHQVVEVTSGSFERVTYGANPHSGAYQNRPEHAAKNAADLEAGSFFYSACRDKAENIPHTRNNWICYDFKNRRIVPTHYAIRSYDAGPGTANLKSWAVETSADGKGWQEVDHRENNNELNGKLLLRTFAVADAAPCRFIRLVNIGKNHWGNDQPCMSAWEIFGRLIE